MEFFISYLVPFLVLLGVLIFIHELGHFSVAKYFGVRVEVFSIGFGRKILKKKVGDTTYCISIIPFGGYVKMYGDDPTAEIPPDQIQYSFKDKPVWPRIAIVLAGPLMNFFLAGLLFIVLAGIGEEFVKPKLGEVFEGTQAYTSGFRTGDTIKSINGNEVRKWDDVAKTVVKSHGETLRFVLDRDGAQVDVEAIPNSVPNKNPLTSDAVVGEIEGFTNLSRASAVGIASPDAAAAKAGLKTGDIIRKIDGVEISKWSELTGALEKAKQAGTKTLKFEVQRGNQTDLMALDYEVPKDNVLGGMEPSEMFLQQAVPDSAAAKAGLEAGDKIVAINGAKLTRWDQLVKTVHGYKESDPPFKVTYARQGVEKTVEVRPTLTTQTDAIGMKVTNFALGVATWLTFAPQETTQIKETTVSGILSRGVSETMHWTKVTALGYVRLFQGRVSAKSLGGPLMIGKLAGDSWKAGFSAFVKLMSVISLNLFLLNLLPFPALDGGYLVLFSVEAIRGTPISFEKLETVWQVGIVLLFGLMVFAMYNDLMRYFFS